MSLSINPFASGFGHTGSTGNDPMPGGPPAVTCPVCGGSVVPVETETGWQSCPSCANRLQAYLWPVLRQNTSAAVALSDQATCFFHPDKAFQACCQRCGRFVCALCDLQLGVEHVCPTCFERGRAHSGVEAGTAEWRYRDVLYDSIAVTVGWVWILIWPTFVAALPAVIFLHVKYRKAPRSYLIPRSGWRFWGAYVGLGWLPLLLFGYWAAGRR
ncbi:MAG TPA: hypothetical protein VF133_14165 [Terriglobales bacterium]